MEYEVDPPAAGEPTGPTDARRTRTLEIDATNVDSAALAIIAAEALKQRGS